MYYINNFFIYSFIGYILEYIMYLICGYKGGILYGPWTPIYGIGSIIILFIYNKYIIKINNHKIIKFLIIFLTGFILLAFIEYLGGNLIELIFNKTIWNYEDYEFNFGKYICLEMSFIWGLSSLIIIYITKKITDIISKKTPKIITYLLIILFVIDLICTIILN